MMSNSTNSSLVIVGCNATLPKTALVGFAPEPNCGRGTTGIIWSCVTVMVFSVWSTIHLNTRTLSFPLWYTPLLQKGTYFFWKPWRKLLRQKADEYYSPEFPSFVVRKVLEAIITLLFPEIGVVVAVEEFVISWYIRRSTRRLPGWEKFSLKQAFLVLMGGVSLPELEAPQNFDQLVANNAHVLYFSTFPSHNQISLRVKKDYTDKIIAISQGVFFVSNFITRWRHSYGFALLELMALNYLVYAVIIFLLRYQKPQDLQEAFKLNLPELVDPDETPFQDWYYKSRPQIFSCIFAVLAAANALTFVSPPGVRTVPITLLTLGGFLIILKVPLDYFFLENLKAWRKRSTAWAEIFCVVSSIYGLIFSILFAIARGFTLYKAFSAFSIATAGIYATPPSWTQYLGHMGA